MTTTKKPAGSLEQAVATLSERVDRLEAGRAVPDLTGHALRTAIEREFKGVRRLRVMGLSDDYESAMPAEYEREWKDAWNRVAKRITSGAS